MSERLEQICPYHTGLLQICTGTRYLPFTIKRNITILQGDSAIGKSTLITVLNRYLIRKDGSNCTIKTNANFDVYLDGDRRDWKITFENLNNTVIFIEENNNFVYSFDFAVLVKRSSNYFVIISRRAIPTLSYSYTEIYTLECKKHKNIQQHVYTFKELYSNYPIISNKIDLVLSEDSNSGFVFFKNLFNKKIISAKGCSNLINTLHKINERIYLIIADGAAFGAYIAVCINYLENNLDKRVILYLPESFEWLLLKSKVIDFPGLDQILENPSDYIESGVYVSWERFFTDLAIKYSDENHKYSKHKLNSYYLNQDNLDKVKSVLPKELQKIIDENTVKNNTNYGDNSNLSQMNLF